MKNYDKYRYNVEFIESLGNIQNQKNYLNKYKNPNIYIKRLKFFLKILKNPHKKIKKYIHIGGTSGKGSVANFIHNILVSSGKKSFLFTSPFLTETIEKYKISNKLISIKEFNIIVENYIKPALDICAQNSPYGIPSYFEVCFAIAIISYTKNNCEYFVSEVGLGGEYDATNIVKKKILTIITHVDLDHTQILGNSLEKIAKTKSKIISRKSIFLTNEPRASIRRIFKKECKNNKAEFNYIKSENIKNTFKKNKFNFEYQNEKYQIIVFGNHQISNAVLAIEACKKLNISSNYIKKGLKNTKIAGRFEIINLRPLIVLDVAHNPDKILSMIDNLGFLRYNKLILIYASAADKNTQKITKILAGYTDKLYLTKFLFSQRICANPKKILNYWKKENKKIKTNIALDPYVALKKALKETYKNDLILIAGSFFLVGEIRKKYWDNKKIINLRKNI